MNILSKFAFFLLLGILIILYMIGGMFPGTNTPLPEKARTALEELAKIDTRAADYVRGLNNERDKRALAIAALSMSPQADKNSRLAKMAEEIRATGKLPYSAQIAQLATDPQSFNTTEDRDDFLAAHLAAAESIDCVGDWQITHEYTAILESARQSPLVWDKVKADPLGLVVWWKTGSTELLEFYHRHRDLLADPMAVTDLSGEPDEEVPSAHPIPTFKTILEKCMECEEILQPLLGPTDMQTEGDGSEEGALGLAELGLALIWTHGKLLKTCKTQHGLDPWEVANIVHLNPDVFGDAEGDAGWIAEKANLLGKLNQTQKLVWSAAMRYPLCIKLFQDADETGAAVVREYGPDAPGAIIYNFFGEEHYTADEVDLVCRAINKFGDMALYVFSNYDGELSSQIRKHLNDPRIGIRVVPFIVRFGNEAFGKLEENIKWLDKYFDPEGDVKDPGWVKNVPGGALFELAKNFASGTPSTWEELGWGTLDAVDVTLTLASFGQSQTVTGPAKAARVAKAVASASKGGKVVRATRSASRLAWKKFVSEVGKRAPRSLSPALRKFARNGALIARATSKTLQPALRVIKAGCRYSSSAFRFAQTGVEQMVRTWKSLTPGTRALVLRGIAAAGVFVTLKYRTLPNLDKIVVGMARATV